MAKSPEAFRTISEVADWLGVQAHVLRFWESKFTQVKPVKRAGGRRYYRPADMQLLGGIRKLLHDDGMTIKGVQKVLREEGINYVSTLSHDVDTAVTLDAPGPSGSQAKPAEPEEKGVVLSFSAEKAEEKKTTEAKREKPKKVEPDTSANAAPKPKARRKKVEVNETPDLFDLLGPVDPEPAEVAIEETSDEDMPPLPNINESDMPAAPTLLSAAYQAKSIAPDHRQQVKSLLDRLTSLRDKMAAQDDSAGTAPPPNS